MNHIKLPLTIFVLIITALPLSTSAATIAELQAQLTALMAQIQVLQQGGTQTQTATPSAPGTSPAQCPKLARTLARGMRGSDVTLLQRFLIQQGHLVVGNDSGFFGALTEAAVKKYQCKHMSICSGTPATTGHGLVGAKTRAALKNCATLTQPQPSCLSRRTETRTISCTQGAGTIVQERSICTSGPSATWTDWTTVSNTCVRDVTLNEPSKSCTFNGSTVVHGTSITAYESNSVQAGYQCLQQSRVCVDGVLSGTYAYSSCTVQTLPTPQQPSCSLSFSPASGIVGSNATLYAIGYNIVSATIDNGIGAVTVSGGALNISRTLQIPASAKTYTLTVVGANGSTKTCTAQISPVVTPPPTAAPTCQLEFSPATGEVGLNTVLYSSGYNLVSATIDNGIGAQSITATGGFSNGVLMQIPATPKTYTLSVVGVNGATRTCSATIVAGTTPPAPTCQLEFSPATGEVGSNTVLYSSGYNLASATIDNGIGARTLSGTSFSDGILLQIPSASKTYTLTVVGTDGTTKTCSATVTPTVVTSAAPTCQLEFVPSSGESGINTVLYASGYNLASATIDNGIGSMSIGATGGFAHGALLQIPTVVKTYTLTVVGTNGTTKTCTATVTPTNQPQVAGPTCQLLFTPASGNVGSNSVLNASGYNLASATIDNGIGAMTLGSGGSFSFGALLQIPSAAKTYILTVLGLNGATKSCSATITPTIQPTIPEPTCQLEFSPSTGAAGSNTILYSSGYNLTSASIDNGIGARTITGTSFSNGVSITIPTSPKTYTLSVVGTNGSTKSCSATITPIVGGGTACTLPDNSTVPDGQTIPMYSLPLVANVYTCASYSQSRTCTNGTMSGDRQYTYRSCAVSGNANAISYPNPNATIPNLPTFQGTTRNEQMPNTLDLVERAQYAITGLTSPLLAVGDYSVYWSSHIGRNPAQLVIGEWEDIDPKFWEALPLMRIMTGSQAATNVDQAWGARIAKSFDPYSHLFLFAINKPFIKFPYFQDEITNWAALKTPYVATVLSNGRIFGYLATIYRLTNDPRWKQLGVDLIAVLPNYYKTYSPGRYYFPSSIFNPFGWPGGNTPPMPSANADIAGRMIHGPALFAMATGDSSGLQISKGFSQFVMKDAGIFNFSSGAFIGDTSPQSQDEGPMGGAHFMRRSKVLDSILDYVAATKQFGNPDTEAAQFVVRSYEWIKQQSSLVNTEIGWFPEFMSAKSLTTDYGVVDMISIAVKLSLMGYGDYWDDVDAWTRNQFASQQLLNSSWIVSYAAYNTACDVPTPGNRGCTTDNAAGRLVGSWGGYTRPNEWSREGGPGVMQDSTGNAARTLFHVWNSITTRKGSEVSVNLPLNKMARDVTVKSYIPNEGKIEVIVWDPSISKLRIRIPKWIQGTISVSRNGTGINTGVEGQYYTIAGPFSSGDTIRIQFTITEQTKTFSLPHPSIEGQKAQMTFTFRGNQAIAVSPGGVRGAFYTNTEAQRQPAVMVNKTGFVISNQSVLNIYPQ